MDQLVEAVFDAFAELPTKKLNYGFLTLQGCFNEILDCHGDNNYKLPHMGKARLERLGLLPVSLDVTESSKIWDVESSDED
jgi:hypothetical protein